MRWFRIRTANSINADLRRTFEQLGPGIMQVSLAVDSSFKHNGEDVWPHDLVHKPLRPFQISAPREIFVHYGGGRPRAKVDAAHIPRLRDSGASLRAIALQLGVSVGTVAACSKKLRRSVSVVA